MPDIQVKVKTKKVPNMRKLNACPVCGAKLEPIHGINLLNEKVIVGYKCVNCDYTTDLDSFMPMKYIFIWKGAKK